VFAFTGGLVVGVGGAGAGEDVAAAAGGAETGVPRSIYVVVRESGIGSGVAGCDDGGWVSY